MSESPAWHDRAFRLLAQYLVGLLWTSALLALVSLNLTPDSARLVVRQIVAVFDSVQIPELAAGFVVVVLGVLAPLILAIVVGPLTSFVAGLLSRLWRRYTPTGSFTTAHYSAAGSRLQRVLCTPLPRGGGAYVMFAYLKQIDSPHTTALRADLRDLAVKTSSIIPVAVLAGSVVFAFSQQDAIGVVSAMVFAVLVFVGASYDASLAARRWEELTLTAFLLATADLSAAPADDEHEQNRGDAVDSQLRVSVRDPAQPQDMTSMAEESTQPPAA